MFIETALYSQDYLWKRSSLILQETLQYGL